MRLNIILIILLMLLLNSGHAVAQDIPTRLSSTDDSLRQSLNDSISLPSYMRPLPSSPAERSAEMERALQSVKQTLAMPSLFAPATGMRNMAPRSYAVPGELGFRTWDGATIGVSGSSSSLPGLMGIERGQITFTPAVWQFYFSGLRKRIALRLLLRHADRLGIWRKPQL